MLIRQFNLIIVQLIISGLSGALSQNIHQTFDATGGNLQIKVWIPATPFRSTFIFHDKD